MKVLVDTNVVLRMADAGHGMHDQALKAIDLLDSQGHECVIVPQILYEYWVVATRPIANNGLGMSPTDTDLAISRWTTLFRLLQDERGIFDQWRTLVTNYEVKGKNAHDARLVAAMAQHGLTHLLSFNKPDFTRFTKIQVFTPDDLLQGRYRLVSVDDANDPLG